MNDTFLMLGIESSCDETAAALVKSDGTILASEIASQMEVHAAHGGVVPEIAARAHLHVTGWQLPDGFERLVWDDESVFGPSPNWGDWRDGPGVDARVREGLGAGEPLVRDRPAACGRGASKHGSTLVASFWRTPYRWLGAIVVIHIIGYVQLLTVGCQSQHPFRTRSR